MSTNSQTLDLDTALASIPAALRKRLCRNYATLKKQSLESQYDAVGHQAGRLSEVLLRVLQQLLTTQYDPLSQELKNFKSQCESLEQVPRTAGPDGIRILMPRALSFLYTLRNKRDAGHTGGEVNANAIDALTAVRIADWCMCELIRVCHNIPLEDAQVICDAIAERSLPAVWSILGRKRVLKTSLSYRDQTLLLLYSEADMAVPTEDLFEWTEHSNRAYYRRDVLGKLHKDRLIEWDRDTEMVIISPTGIAKVEEDVLPALEI